MFESVTLHLIPAQRHREKSHSSSRNQRGRNQKRNPSREAPLVPGCSWWWTCVLGRSSAGRRSWNWKLWRRHPHFLWTLQSNHTAWHEARREQPCNTSSHQSTNLPKTSSQRTRAYHHLALASSQVEQVLIILISAPARLASFVVFKHWTPSTHPFVAISHSDQMNLAPASSFYIFSPIFNQKLTVRTSVCLCWNTTGRSGLGGEQQVQAALREAL